MKRKVIAAALVQLFLTLLSLLLAYNLDCLAGGRAAACSPSIVVALGALTSPKVLTLFLLFTALSALAVFCMAFGRSYIKYRSDMQTIVPGVCTPRPEGQGQYGTAQWLDPRRLPEVFSEIQVDRDAPLLRKLMAEGRDDLKQ